MKENMNTEETIDMETIHLKHIDYGVDNEYPTDRYVVHNKHDADSKYAGHNKYGVHKNMENKVNI